MLMRLLNVAVFASVCVTAGSLYYFKHDTRRLKAEATRLEQQIRKERENIAVLKTEWGHLTRPERLERLAREYLGMQPVTAGQVHSPDLVTGTLPPKRTPKAILPPKTTSQSVMPVKPDISAIKQSAPRSIEDLLEAKEP